MIAFDAVIQPKNHYDFGINFIYDVYVFRVEVNIWPISFWFSYFRGKVTVIKK